MRIAIDAMGGDNAPAQIIEGALQALPALEAGDEIILVGNQEAIQPLLANAPARPASVRIHHASQVVTMSDSPVEAIRGKRDSSIVKMVKLAKDGEADALISAGNTGALVAVGVLMLKPLAGVERPGIAVLMPSVKGAVMMCDGGANVQPKALHLYQYAVMTSYYCKALRNIDRPTVAILNIGTEEEKGTPLVKEVRELIKADANLNFIGYVEGRDIPKHPCDVLVTDGFTGNVTLKVAEGFSEAMMRSVMKEAAADADLAAKLQPLIGRVMKRYDHEEAGGAMLLGVQGMFFKVHGSTGARGIKNTVATVKSLSKLNVASQIESHLATKPA